MPKIEMEVIVKPGEIKEIVAEDGVVVIKGQDDPDLVKLLVLADKMTMMKGHVHLHAEQEIMFFIRGLSPRLQRLLRERPLA